MYRPEKSHSVCAEQVMEEEESGGSGEAEGEGRRRRLQGLGDGVRRLAIFVDKVRKRDSESVSWTLSLRDASGLAWFYLKYGSLLVDHHP